MAIEEIDLYQLTPDMIEMYLPGDDCGKCTGKTCSQMAKDILSGKGKASECPKLGRALANAIDSVAGLKISLAESDPMMTMSGEKLVELNSPGEDSPIMITADSSITVPILKRIFAATEVKAFLVPVDTMGYTLDNAVETKNLSPLNVMKAVMDSGLIGRAESKTLIIPGLARSLEKNIERATRYHIEVGPNSGFELPIYLASKI
ncbi:MAG: (Fe-S)-binding protein [Methanomassiliicoccales archaeon]|jgi:acetyl-CoA decarbonylase/synthase complex subunit gamma